MRESLFFISTVVISVIFIFIWIIFFGPVKGEEKTYIQDSTFFAIVVMGLLLLAFIAVAIMVLLL